MNAASDSGRNSTTLCYAAIALIVLVYLVQLLSPLRLNTDAVTLLSMACNAQDGLGFTERGHATQFPLAYPLVLLGLIKAHIACSATFIAFNMLCLGIAIWQFSKIASRYWIESPTRIGWIIAFFLLSFSTIKHVTIPLTEMPFSAVMMSSLRCLTEWNLGERRSWLLLLLGAVLALCSIFVRTLGIALLPAVGWAVVADPVIRAKLLLQTKKPLVLLPGLIGVLVIAGGAFWFVSNTKYFHMFVAQAHEPSVLLKTAFTGRFTDATELFCNLPIDKLGHQPWSMGIGIIPIALAALGFIKRRRAGTLEIFLLCYIAIMVVWPYRDARFWIPVLPFMMLLLGGGFDALPIPKFATIVKCAYLAVFAIIGITALAISTKLSISGDRFADRYGTAATRATYQTAFGRPADLSNGVYPDWIKLLERLEPRARRVGNPNSEIRIPESMTK